MKFNLLALTLLLNILFLVRASIENKSINGPGQDTIHEITNDDYDEFMINDSDMNNGLDNTVDDTKYIEETNNSPPVLQNRFRWKKKARWMQSKHKRTCPKDLSSFTKNDLYLMVKYISDDFNILPNITGYLHDIASNASQIMLLDFTKFKTDLELRQNLLNHVLDSMKNAREKNIVPLVKVAVAALGEFPKVQDEFNLLYSNATKMLRNLGQYKQLCKLNNCPTVQLRTFFPSSASALTMPANSEYICTTVEVVRKTVHDQLLSYELQEIEKIKKYLPLDNKYVSEELACLKKRLKEAVQKQFGTTMYDILSLSDDSVHFMNSLVDFNSKSYTSALKKNSVTIQYSLLDLADKIEKYRQHCLSCEQLQSRRSFRMNVQSATENKNLLNEAINDEINEIARGVKTYTRNIYKKVDDIINDNKYVEKTIGSLKPLQENIVAQLKVQEKALETLVQSVPQAKRQHAHEEFMKSVALLQDINEAIKFVEKY